MLVLQIEDIKKIVSKKGFRAFISMLVETLEVDYQQWEGFDKSARVATHVEGGVIELMPISNKEFYTFKYVNGHPKNPKENKFTVMATGQLSQTSTGEPLLFSEMTLLTALRTAATSAMAAKYLAKKDSKVLALIGTGAQSEFQTLAFLEFFKIEEIRYYDIDKEAMKKYEKNIQHLNVKLTPCKDTPQAVKGADIITTCTADKRYQTILTKQMIENDVFINALGGDCPGKTELEKALLQTNTIVVEYLKQSRIEGEIQQLEKDFTCTELYEVIRKEKELNVQKNGTIIYDSVGFALEDYSVLRLIYSLAKEYNVGQEMHLIPNISNVKDLFSLIKKDTHE